MVKAYKGNIISHKKETPIGGGICAANQLTINSSLTAMTSICRREIDA
jgi:hypothetical protein